MSYHAPAEPAEGLLNNGDDMSNIAKLIRCFLTYNTFGDLEGFPPEPDVMVAVVWGHGASCPEYIQLATLVHTYCDAACHEGCTPDAEDFITYIQNL